MTRERYKIGVYRRNDMIL